MAEETKKQDPQAQQPKQNPPITPEVLGIDRLQLQNPQQPQQGNQGVGKIPAGESDLEKGDSLLKPINEILDRQRTKAAPAGAGSLSDPMGIDFTGMDKDGLNPHSVPLSKKTSDGLTEFTGPLTVEGFRQTKMYQDTKARITSDFLNDTPEGQEIKMSMHSTRDPQEYTRDLADSTFRITGVALNEQILVQNELASDGKYVPSKIIIGQYVYHPAAVESENLGEIAAGAIGAEPPVRGRYINVNSVHDFKTNETYKIAGGAVVRPGEAISASATEPSAFVIPLSPEGHLLQAGADILAGNTKELEKLLNIYHPQKSGTAAVQLHYADGDYSLGSKQSERMLRTLDRVANGPSKEYGVVISEDRLSELDAAIDSERFSRALSITETDAAGKETRLILLGGSKPAGSVEKLTRIPVKNIVFTQSFNVENGKTSPLEKPIELPVSDGRARQENIDEVVKQVKEAVEKNQISQLAPKGTNPQFDELLKNADKVALGYDGAVPNVPQALEKKKLAGVV